jgi:hypothetical protein
MPLTTPAQYAEMLDAAKAGGYAYKRRAEQAMAARVVEACHQLGSAGRSLTGHAPPPRRA